MGPFSFWRRCWLSLKAAAAFLGRPFGRLRNLLPTPWYLHPSVDYYVFVIFSWLVWQPLFSSWGYYGLVRAANRLGPYWSLYPHVGGWSQLAYFPWLADVKFRMHAPSLGGLGDPSADLDFTTTTDSEDLAVFAADVLEFAEQDGALLTDALFDLGAGSVFVAGLFMWLARRTLPAALARKRR